MAKKLRSVPNAPAPRKRACDIYPKPVYGEVQSSDEVRRALTAIVLDTTRPHRRRPERGPSKIEVWGWAAVIVMLLAVAAVSMSRPSKAEPQLLKTYPLQPN